MPFLPFTILGIWIRSLLAVAIIAGGFFCLRLWYEDSLVLEYALRLFPKRMFRWRRNALRLRTESRIRFLSRRKVEHSRRVFQFNPGWNRETAFLAAGIALLAWAVVGRWVGQGVAMA